MERTPLAEVIVSDPDAKVEMYAGLTTPIAFEERAGRYHRLGSLQEIGNKVAEIVGEAAEQWGTPYDAAVCRRWPTTARSLFGQSQG